MDSAGRIRNDAVAEQSRANIKPGSVATDILGVSGREMIRALIGGQEDANQLAELARRRLRTKLPELRESLRGHLTEHHRFMPRQLINVRAGVPEGRRKKGLTTAAKGSTPVESPNRME